mgnify:CR=1 FL=1
MGRWLGRLSVLDLLLLKLQGIQLVVPAVLLQQLLVTALLQNPALGQEDDVVGVLDGTEAMGHDQHGADVLHLFQRVLDQDLRFRVDVGGGLVQDHDGRLVSP